MTSIVPTRESVLPPRSEDRPGFDYATVDQAVANRLRASADKIRDLFKRTTESMVAMGKELRAIKAEKLPRGQFGKWLADEFSMTERTAQRFMSLAEFAELNSDILSGVGPSTAYLLAARSTPTSVISDVRTRIARGERITFERVRILNGSARWDETRAKRKRGTAQRARTRSKIQQSEVAPSQYQRGHSAAAEFARLVGERIRDIRDELCKLHAETEAVALYTALKAVLANSAPPKLTSPVATPGYLALAPPNSDPPEIPELLRRKSDPAGAQDATVSAEPEIPGQAQ